MMIEQYKPQKPNPRNALQTLQLMRIEARREADTNWKTLKQSVYDTTHPKPVRSRQSAIFNALITHAQTIATGALLGAKVMTIVKTWRKGAK